MRSLLSLLAPTFTPIGPESRLRRSNRSNAAGWPRLLKPIRLITARSSDKPEQPRERIAGLRERRDRAHFDEAEAEREHLLGDFGILVEARGKSDRIGKAQPRDPRLERRRRWRSGRECGACPQFQKGDRRPMRALGVEAKQQRTDQRVEGHALRSSCRT